MKYCHFCHRLTAGTPLFCEYCGRSYSVKLCPKLHINPRAALVCGQCGSKELSTPAPKLPFYLRPAAMLFSPSLGKLLLSSLVLWMVFIVFKLLLNPNSFLSLVLIAMLVGFVFVSWMKLKGSGKAHKK